MEPVRRVQHHRPRFRREAARQPPQDAPHRRVAVEQPDRVAAEDRADLVERAPVVPQQERGTGDVKRMEHQPQPFQIGFLRQIGGLPHIGGIMDGIPHFLQDADVVRFKFA